MDIKRYLRPSFLKYQDVVDGPRTERIAAVQEGTFDCLDLKFESGDMLSLNQTNLRTLVRAYGMDPEKWIGKLIELYAGQTTFDNEPKQSVLIKPISPPNPSDEDIPF